MVEMSEFIGGKPAQWFTPQGYWGTPFYFVGVSPIKHSDVVIMYSDGSLSTTTVDFLKQSGVLLQTPVVPPGFIEWTGDIVDGVTIELMTPTGIVKTSTASLYPMISAFRYIIRVGDQVACWDDNDEFTSEKEPVIELYGSETKWDHCIPIKQWYHMNTR
jgi:hypothetical protein